MGEYRINLDDRGDSILQAVASEHDMDAPEFLGRIVADYLQVVREQDPGIIPRSQENRITGDVDWKPDGWDGSL